MLDKMPELTEEQYTWPFTKTEPLEQGGTETSSIFHEWLKNAAFRGGVTCLIDTQRCIINRLSTNNKS